MIIVVICSTPLKNLSDIKSELLWFVGLFMVFAFLCFHCLPLSFSTLVKISGGLTRF